MGKCLLKIELEQMGEYHYSHQTSLCPKGDVTQQLVACSLKLEVVLPLPPLVGR